MGITSKEYFENIYEVIFTPLDFFKRKDLTVSIRQAAGTIVWVSLFTILGKEIGSGEIFNNVYISFLLIFKIILILVAWALTGLFLEYIAKIFSRDCGLNNILFNTSFAMVPYIFFAPLDILKHSGDTGYTIGAIAEMFLYLWIIVLYALAIKKSYDISIARSFMMILLPFIGTFFAISWAIGFITKMVYINSI